MEVKHDGKGGVKVLASPSKDERHAYTPDQAQHLADSLTAAAQEATNYLVSVAHQDMVNAPNPHAAQEPADETEAPDSNVGVADLVIRSDASTPTAPTPQELDPEDVDKDEGRQEARSEREKAQEAAAKRAAGETPPKSQKTSQKKAASEQGTPAAAKKRERSQASKDAAAKKAREKRAAAKKAAK